jgi:Flp pilus assembly pilin Flp
MKTIMVSFARDEQGQDLIEYALLLGLISVLSLASITASGTKINQAPAQLGSFPGRYLRDRSGRGSRHLTIWHNREREKQPPPSVPFSTPMADPPTRIPRDRDWRLVIW